MVLHALRCIIDALERKVLRKTSVAQANTKVMFHTITSLWVALDLLQVDLLFGREAADCDRRSREGMTCLAWWVSICISRQKWGVAWLAFGVSGFICESLTSKWWNVLIPLWLNLMNVCVYLHHRTKKFVYFVRKLSLAMILGESWRPKGAGKRKQKLASISSQYWDRRFHNQGILAIRTHFKPTETFLYTHFSWPCNPHGVRKDLIKG